ncbi:Uncharacterised protein [Neisseria dentiae]|nr:Uncharacterised protein [Neisseria dentiae]
MNNKAVCLFQTALIASINIANQLKNNYLQNSCFRHAGYGAAAVRVVRRHLLRPQSIFGGSRFLQSGHYTR